jgi:hypothetical protein
MSGLQRVLAIHGTEGRRSRPAEPWHGILFLNETRITLTFYIDGKLACAALAGLNCMAQTTVGSHFVEAKGRNGEYASATIEVTDSRDMPEWTITEN